MQTIQKTTKRCTRVEITARELAMLDAAMFDALVRLYKDSKGFDVTNPDDDDALIECRADADIIKGIQRKLEFARKQIELESAT